MQLFNDKMSLAPASWCWCFSAGTEMWQTWNNRMWGEPLPLTRSMKNKTWQIHHTSCSACVNLSPVCVSAGKRRCSGQGEAVRGYRLPLLPASYRDRSPEPRLGTAVRPASPLRLHTEEHVSPLWPGVARVSPSYQTDQTEATHHARRRCWILNFLLPTSCCCFHLQTNFCSRG